MKRISIRSEKFRFTGFGLPVPHKVVAKCLVDIYNKNHHELTPDILVQTAKAKTHPLHPCFEWDDKKAGAEYRLTQARKIIQCVTVIKQAENRTTEVRAFVSIRRDEKGNLTHNPFAKGESTYVYVTDAMQDDYLRQYTKEKALLELSRWLDKYKNVEALTDFCDKLEGEIKKLK